MFRRRSLLLLVALLAVQPAGGDSGMQADGPLWGDQGLSGPEAVIHRALRRKVKADFRQTPLREVAAALQDRLGVTVILDRASLDDAHIADDTPVTLEVVGLSGRSALELILGQLDLRWHVQGRAILITTPEAAEETLDERSYDVSDLIHRLDDDGGPGFESLICLLTSCIEPASWEDNGGAGEIEPSEAVGAKALVVSQTQAVHERIRGLLADVRRCRGKQVRPAYPAHPAEAAIRHALDKRLTLGFKETPLEDVAATLEEKLGAPVLLDRRALDDQGIAADTPVSFAVAGISGRAALNHLLRPMNLTWTIRHEVLLITTPEQSDGHLAMRVYDVADLAGNGPTAAVMLGGGEPGELDQLCDTIASCVAPPTWDRAGGPGTIAPLEDAGLQVLVIVQRQDVLERVETLLADLRKLRSAKPPANACGAGVSPARAAGTAAPRGAAADLGRLLSKRVTLDLAEVHWKRPSRG
jgi:hypothetical protein